MAKNWDYANYAHQAKSFGGPEKMMEIVKAHSYQQGVKATLPYLLVAAAGGFMVGQVPKAYRFIRSKLVKDEIPDEVAHEAEVELIRGMEDASCEEANGIDASTGSQPSATE